MIPHIYGIFQVNEVNVHPPKFETDYVETLVSEDAPLGTSVATLTATDNDAAETSHADLTYRIVSGNEDAWFEVHPASGLVTVVSDGGLDRESRPDGVVLTVTAEDRGNKAKTATAQVSVTLTDVNDNATSFGQDLYNVTVLESAEVRHTLSLLFSTGILSYTPAPLLFKLTATV